MARAAGTPPSAWRLLWRAARLRCPHCGGGAVFTSWFRMCPTCPGCGLTLQRGEQGYWLGAWFVNLMAMEALLVAWGAGVMWATWPDPAWDAMQHGAIALMVAAPFVFFPWSRLLYLGFDLRLRPACDDDFRLPVEPALGRRRG